MPGRPDAGPGRLRGRFLGLFVGLALSLASGLASAQQPPAPPSAAQLPAPIVSALKQAAIPDSHIGLLVQDLGTGQPLLAHGEARSFNPASAMKLITTLAALDMLGPAHTWQTGVLVEGEIRDGQLLGNLILKGGGDPGLSLERFWLLLREIRARGIRKIEGDVILDNSLYAIEPVDPGAFDQEPLRPYNARPAALLVNHNAVGLRLQPRGTGLDVRLEPAALKLAVSAQTTAQEACGDWREHLRFQRQDDVLQVQGSYPQVCGERQIWLNLLAPEEHVAAVFASLWTELGGTLMGRVRQGNTPEPAQPLLDFPSLPLGRLVLDVNEHSNNVMAKMLFLNLGLHRLGGPAAWYKGEAAVRAWLAENGLRFPELVLENGSGLSRIERISAASLARLLTFAASRPVFHEFVASLPSLGREGTLKQRLSDQPQAGRTWLKTGTLNGARNIAGYVLDAQGRYKTLILLINHARAPQAAPVQDAVIDWAFAAATAPIPTLDPVPEH